MFFEENLAKFLNSKAKLQHKRDELSKIDWSGLGIKPNIPMAVALLPEHKMAKSRPIIIFLDSNDNLYYLKARSYKDNDGKKFPSEVFFDPTVYDPEKQVFDLPSLIDTRQLYMMSKNEFLNFYLDDDEPSFTVHHLNSDFVFNLYQKILENLRGWEILQVDLQNVTTSFNPNYAPHVVLQKITLNKNKTPILNPEILYAHPDIIREEILQTKQGLSNFSPNQYASQKYQRLLVMIDFGERLLETIDLKNNKAQLLLIALNAELETKVDLYSETSKVKPKSRSR